MFYQSLFAVLLVVFEFLIFRLIHSCLWIRLGLLKQILETDFFEHFKNLYGNGQSYLVRKNIQRVAT